MVISICVGTTCHLLGSSSLVEAINELPEKYLNNVSIKYSTCFDVCHGQMKPPIAKIDDKLYDDLSPDKIKKIIIAMVGDN
ncbi:(2Fe-2S) ferredoxin domain-containing protein [Oceanotoga sp. DSM 15011]|jgi:NADH:ubiquinone oxidoreductase subunit E|uniref:Thioredoxin-like protein n=1 Tax=Oceanotoga teriensis TaxID=515440 RepID=A0AA45C8K9_9BACT|nr:MULTISPECIES: (2Fe-2S) ferredoxin domain-containing protein [Oceanotoga]MDN5342051.1 hypothetical protein [Oceanotoga sp.]MDO7975479.1 (2Fe-2S) ferredoxin domain-containing protein [Oceanotoga teriensis]PWJ96233.1 thioredoxin-like protein [Oceanotoga teriensis]UYP00017.1 (2Fe-2S) ferredoxin domain-containing protein [Oceanotoga sp. DSM 15011]